MYPPKWARFIVLVAGAVARGLCVKAIFLCFFVLVGVGWGGVDGVITFMYACWATSCYVEVAFLHACTSTLCYVVVAFFSVLARLHIYAVLR